MVVVGLLALSSPSSPLTRQEPMPRSTAIHNGWYLPTSIISEDTLPDMYIDQCIRDNSLLRISSSVILGHVKLTIKTKQYSVEALK